jgi:hypothetical protein
MLIQMPSAYLCPQTNNYAGVSVMGQGEDFAAAESLSRWEWVARDSGPGEGYYKVFFIGFSFLYPSPGASHHTLPSGEGFTS